MTISIEVTHAAPTELVVETVGTQGPAGSGSGGVSSWNDLTDKPLTFPPDAHTHDDRYYTEAEITAQMANKSDTTHDHDSRYYTETEVDTALGDKANADHTHAYADLTGKPTLPLSLNVKKTSATAYTSTTLADDPTLQFELPTGDYDFELFVLYDASVNNDIKLSLEFSGTATCALLAGSYAASTSTSFASATGLTHIQSGFNVSILYGFGGNMFAGANGVGVTLGFRVQGRIFVTATGTVKLRAAKNANTDTAIDTSTLPGSYMSAVEVISSP